MSSQGSRPVRRDAPTGSVQQSGVQGCSSQAQAPQGRVFALAPTDASSGPSVLRGKVAYRLALPPQLDKVHNVFHVSMLQKYEPDPPHILDWVDVDVDEDVSYEEGPVQILDT
ncbi:uncharacterized protein LOC132313905 [Cornus florida]|uniref:uncharacterized protein LOC132313905 n=1 Tax=Cornus florida TaxID=4283 RepID=UPI00289E054E|nr:uncharacterized protein LOC132313905 [Cornus florida]